MRSWTMCAASAAILALGGCGSDSGSAPIATVTPTPSPTPSPTPTPTPTAAASLITPANGDTAAYSDTRLSITFDAAPTLGPGGLVRVFKTDGTLVDTIDTSGAPVTAGGETQTTFAVANTEIDKLGNNVPGLAQWRYTYYRPVSITGNVATIQLHDGVLANATGYYVTVGAGVLSGKYKGAAFAGFSAKTDWAFTTKAAPASQVAVTVDDDGPADFRTVQGALDYMMGTGCDSCAHAADAKMILLKTGSYDGQLFLRNTSNLTITGENQTGTVVRTDNYEAFNSGTGGSRPAPNTTFANIGGSATLGNRRVLGGGRSLMLVEGGDLLKLTNFTLQNTHVKSATINNQAEAIYFNSSSLAGSRLIASYMNFLGTQDTVQAKGWVWITNSLVAGDVDFMWGSPYAFLVENSVVRTVADTANPASGGYIFQARAAKGYPGFVVLNSSLTADPGVPIGMTYLARSGGNTQANGYCTTPPVAGGTLGNPQLYCDNVAYINTRMGGHIADAGWFNNPLPNLAPTATEGWRETGSISLNTGGPLPLSGRNTAIASTTADLSGLSTRAKVFASWNGGVGWAPAP